MNVMRVRYKMIDVLAIILLVSVMTVSSHTNFQSQLWVTKILSDTLGDYVPDGGTACRRHGLLYHEELRDLKLWATQSKLDGNLIIIVRSVILNVIKKKIWESTVGSRG